MQVYQRIQNPFMPQGVANDTNAPDTATFPFYSRGEIGCAFYDPNTNRAHARVRLDSGATSATPIGAVAIGQLAFWKDRTLAIVTNDKRFCDVGPSGSVNRVAGVFTVAATASNITDICIQGKGVTCVIGAALAGAQAICDSTADTAKVNYTTGVGTAPASQVIGTFVSATTVDVNLGSFIA
jgi:hypothetical protein